MQSPKYESASTSFDLVGVKNFMHEDSTISKVVKYYPEKGKAVFIKLLPNLMPPLPYPVMQNSMMLMVPQALSGKKEKGKPIRVCRSLSKFQIQKAFKVCP